MKLIEKVIILLVSVAVIFIVSLLILDQPVEVGSNRFVKMIPHINGIINSLTAVLLLMGYKFVKSGNQSAHKKCMLTSFSLGIIFLILYISYHIQIPSTSFGGSGLLKYIYYFLLVTHIIFSIFVAPLVLFALVFALKKEFHKHKRIVKFAYPTWLYVSVSGVLVYMLISPYY